MCPRLPSLCEVHGFWDPRLRLQQHQEEGCWKYPRGGWGVCKLSVSKDRSESWKFSLTPEFPLPATPIRAKKRVSGSVLSLLFGVTSSAKSRISCRNAMPGARAQRASWLNAPRNAFTMGSIHNQWVHTTRATPTVSYPGNALGVQAKSKSPLSYPPLMPLGHTKLPGLTGHHTHQDSPLSTETHLNKGSPWIQTHLSRSSRLLCTGQSLRNHGYHSYFWGRRGYRFNPMKWTPQTWT